MGILGREVSASEDEYDGLRDRERSWRPGEAAPLIELMDEVPDDGEVVRPLGWCGGSSLSVDAPRDGARDGGRDDGWLIFIDEKLGTDAIVAFRERTLTDRGMPMAAPSDSRPTRTTCAWAISLRPRMARSKLPGRSSRRSSSEMSARKSSSRALQASRRPIIASVEAMSSSRALLDLCVEGVA